MKTFKTLLVGLTVLLSSLSLPAANPDNIWQLSPASGMLVISGDVCTQWGGGSVSPWFSVYVRVYDTTGMSGSIDLNQLTPIAQLGYAVAASSRGPESDIGYKDGFEESYRYDMGDWSYFSVYFDGLDDEKTYTVQIDYDSMFGAPNGGFCDVGSSDASVYRTFDNFQLSMYLGW